MQAHEDIIVGLDIGTTKICAVVGAVSGEEINIIGIGTHPSIGLRKGVVTGNAEHLRVEILVFLDAGRYVAELAGAHTGEGHRHEQQHDVGLADLLAELDQLRTLGGFGYEGEIRGFVANFDAHVGYGVVAVRPAA